jgi:hypothetical protein
MLDRLILASVFAIFLSLGAYAQSQPAPSETPQINLQQESDRPFKPENEAKQPQERPRDITVSIPQPITMNLNHNAAQKTDGSENEGTEYWPVFWGLHLKITDSLLALFTLLLFIATGVLGWSTVALWRVTRDEFVATHRPRLRIRGISFDGFTNERIQLAWVYVQNVGVNSALNIRFDAVFAQKVAPGIRKPPWIDKLSPNITHGPQKLISGQRGTFEPSTPHPLGPHEANEIRVLGYAPTLMLIGRICYVDSVGIERETGFGWIYDPRVSDFQKPEKEDEFN